MGTLHRADIGAVIELAQRLRAVRRQARRFAELHDHHDLAPLVQRLLDELIEHGRARLEAALAEAGGV